MATNTIHQLIHERALPPETLLFVTAETIRTVGGLLSDIGIDFVVLKGPHLACTIYPDPLQRSWCDLDILVRPADSGKALACLQAHGFTPAPEDSRRHATMQSYYNVNLMTPLGLPLELHHALSSHQRYPVDVEQMILDAEPFSIMDVHAKGLKTEHLLLHLCIHMTNDYFLHEEKHLEDIALLVRKRAIRWDAFEVLARRAGCMIGSYYALAAACAQKNAPVPEALLVSLKPGFLRAIWLNRFLDPHHDPVYIRKDHDYAKAMLRIGLPMMDRLADAVAVGLRYMRLRTLDFVRARRAAPESG